MTRHPYSPSLFMVLSVLCVFVKATATQEYVSAGDSGTLRLVPIRFSGSDAPIPVVEVASVSDLTPADQASLQKAITDAEQMLQPEQLENQPKDLVFYTAKIINLLRLKRGFSVISRLFPQFVYPSTRRKTSFQQRATSDDYYEQEIQTRRAPIRPFRPRLRWG